VAFDDADQNLRWGGENERIGFVDTMLQLSATSQPNLNIQLFSDFSRLRLMDKNASRYGVVKLTYNGYPDTVKLRTDNPGLHLKKEMSLDTLLVWYDHPESGPWQLIAGSDTIQVKNLPREDFMKNHRVTIAGEVVPVTSKAKRKNALQPTVQPLPNQPAQIITQYMQPTKPGQIIFNNLVQSFDTAKWKIILDSMPFHKFGVSLDSTKPRVGVLQIAWKEGASYELMLLPGAVTDFFGVSNADTIRRKLVVSTEKALGGLNLTLSSLKPGKHYVMQLINGNSVLEEERIFDATTTDKRFVFTKLPTSTYSVKLIEDNNLNNRWDSGSFTKHRQPELLYTKKLESLRANWEIEATFDISGKVVKEKEKK
jgi:hypothetical protein